MGLNWQAMPACGRVAFTLCFLAAAAACARSTPELLLEVPAELQGTWRAEDADWEGAYLDFRALFVEIGRVDGDSDLYPVVGVTVDAQPPRQLLRRALQRLVGWKVRAARAD